LEKKENKSSMFRGCNFVFDNRGAVRVSDAVGLYTLNDVVL
jgi:predicted sulfurtransferase